MRLVCRLPNIAMHSPSLEQLALINLTCVHVRFKKHRLLFRNVVNMTSLDLNQAKLGLGGS